MKFGSPNTILTVTLLVDSEVFETLSLSHKRMFPERAYGAPPP